MHLSGLHLQGCGEVPLSFPMAAERLLVRRERRTLLLPEQSLQLPTILSPYALLKASTADMRGHAWHLGVHAILCSAVSMHIFDTQGFPTFSPNKILKFSTGTNLFQEALPLELHPYTQRRREERHGVSSPPARKGKERCQDVRTAGATYLLGSKPTMVDSL